MPLMNWLENYSCKNIRTKVLGTSPISIDSAEDREQFELILRDLEIRQPLNGIARTKSEAIKIAERMDKKLRPCVSAIPAGNEL